MLSPRKIELAILFVLHRHAEANGSAIAMSDVLGLFDSEFHIPLRRVEVALEELEKRQEVTKSYDRYSDNENAWQISGAGIQIVDRALKIPTTFIARLHDNGVIWLASEDAEKAVLNKTKKDARDPAVLFSDDLMATDSSPVQGTPPIHITNNFAPTNNVSAKASAPYAPSDRSGWWSLAAAIVFGILTIVVALWVAGKI